MCYLVFKQKLREKAKNEILKYINSEERIRQDKKIKEKLLDHPIYKSSKNICIFVSRKDEVNTHLIIEVI